MKVMEPTISELVLNAGSARSYAMEALYNAKQGDYESAGMLLEKSDIALSKAHETQTDLIQEECRGNVQPVNIVQIHAQDHIMCAMVIRDMAKEMVELYRRLNS